MFRKVDQRQDFVKLETDILDFWNKEKILEKYLSKNNDSDKRFSFLDGPITANNPMGVHHAWGRTYKDVIQRYKTMDGYNQRYQNGFDCQGLWVEVEVEKEFGFETKKDIENFGLESFTNKCKERVLKYSAIQTEQSKRLGMFMDWEHSYYTMSDENNYAIWHFLKKCNEKGYLYKGHDVVPWCQRCGTAISQHEILTEEYKELSHQSFFVKFQLKDIANTFFLVWTTTPWTLPANTGLAVGENIKYILVRSNDSEDKYILAENIADKIFGKNNFEVLEWEDGKNYKYGLDLAGLEYTSVLPEIQNNLELDKTNLFKVWTAEFVNTEEGTGIVHIAPGCGKEDFELSKSNNIPVINPIKNDEGDYADDFGTLANKNVSNIREEIKELLGDRLFRVEVYTHRYPTCWRCKSELIFRLVDEWYIRMDDLRQPMIDLTKQIKWLPSFGLDRELDWLKNMDDWLISKKRYWGLALPIYECECGNIDVIGSKEELKEKSVSGWEKFEGNSPHRPWIDEVKIKCSKCGKDISRVKDVGNPWLDAGIVPFSTIPGYKTGREPKPTTYFNDKEEWEKWFPVDFITESFPGQFKNWFYSLIAMSAVLENKPPFMNVLGYASVKDEKGEEMHKSKGNAIWFDEAAEKIGVDTMRFLYSLQNPANNLLFGYSTTEEIRRKYILILWNVYSFFVTYANIDNFKVENGYRSKNILDRWIISELNQTIDLVRKGLDQYDIQKPTKKIALFIENLSTWYLRRSRNRKNNDFYQTMYYVLFNFAKVIAPITPFLSESIYQNLKSDTDPQSVHLCDYPSADKSLIDKSLADDMVIAREIVENVHSVRTEVGVKVRQPLSDVVVNVELGHSDELNEVLSDELNIKTIKFVSNKDIKDYDSNPEYVKKISGDIVILLNKNITEELIEEGLVRECIRKIQDLRKKSGFNPGDKVSIFYNAQEENARNFIKKYLDILSSRTNSELLRYNNEDTASESKVDWESGSIIFYTEK